HSVFLYDPILLLAIVGAMWLWRRARRETALLLACIGAQVALYSNWSDWSGGYSYAARFLLDILPLGVVLAAPVIAAPRTRPAALLCGGRVSSSLRHARLSIPSTSMGGLATRRR